MPYAGRSRHCRIFYGKFKWLNNLSLFHMMSTPKDMNECKTLGPPGTAFLGDGKVPGLLCYQQCARHQIWSTPAAKSPSSPKRQAPRRDQVCSEYCSWRSWNSLADSCKKMTDFMKHFTECPERVDTFGFFFCTKQSHHTKPHIIVSYSVSFFSRKNCQRILQMLPKLSNIF